MNQCHMFLLLLWSSFFSRFWCDLRAWRWWGSSEARYSCLAWHAPTKSSEAWGVHFLLALGLGLAPGQYLSNPACIDCCRPCTGALVWCHVDSCLSSVNES